MSVPNCQTQRSLAMILALMLVWVLLPRGADAAEDEDAPAETTPAPTADTTPDVPESERARLERQVRSDGSRAFRFHPALRASEKFNEALHPFGITYQLQVAFYYQYASRVTSGQQNFGSFSWLFSGSWRMIDAEGLGSIFVDATLLGSPGLNYDPKTVAIDRNISSVSDLNGNVYPNAAALDEVVIKYVSPENQFVGLLGKIDLSNRFDSNRVANDAFRQFTAFALVNNLSIPWPDYGGIGGFFRFDFGNHYYIMAGAAASVVEEGFRFGSGLGDGNWIEMAELGAEFEVPYLGRGHYRLTPWHSQTPSGEGWGVSINFDQAVGLPQLVTFFRFGIGEPSATPIRLFVSLGLGWLQPWGRPHDMVGFGAAQSNPSPGQGLQNETLVEFFYRFAIFPWMQLSPDLQVVFNPANDLRQNLVVVPGIRLNMTF